MAEKKIIRKKSRRRKKKYWKWPVALLLFLILLGIVFWIYPFWGIPLNGQRHGNPPLTPAWALECWLWEDDVNTAARVEELLTGYKEYDIPVRTILIDSPWSTRYNDFRVDTLRYPHPEKWFPKLQNEGYRVVLWMTCMVNSRSQDTAIRNSQSWFNSARQKGYLAGDGFEVNWWKGKGGFIDYTNPLAMKWWHGMQDQVLRYGIDGWKLDGTATYFSSKFGPIRLPYQEVFAGLLTTRGYMDRYYREEYHYGRSKNPEFVTLARAVDTPWAHPEGFAPVDAAPVTWVGDQEHAWRLPHEKENSFSQEAVKNGIEEALSDVLHSARLGYNIIGSDVAGFSGKTIPPRLYIRWAQFSTFCGLFLNGGHGERRLWKRSPQELEIIRKYAWLHTELIPYMFHYVVTAHAGGAHLQKPVKGKYEYLFGDYFLVAPIYEDSTARKVTFPPGRWRYFFDDSRVFRGPNTVDFSVPLDEFPVFVKEGAIIPLNVRRAYTGLGNRQSEKYVTYLIYPAEKSQFTVFNSDGKGQTQVSVQRKENFIQISFSGVHKPHILRIFAEKPPRKILLDGRSLNEGSQWHYNIRNRKLMIRTDAYQEGIYKILE